VEAHATESPSRVERAPKRDQTGAVGHSIQYEARLDSPIRIGTAGPTGKTLEAEVAIGMELHRIAGSAAHVGYKLAITAFYAQVTSYRSLGHRQFDTATVDLRLVDARWEQLE
jgi:hypothetical protein